MNDMIYYIEVNIICIVFLLMFYIQMRQNGSDSSTDRNIFKRIIWTAIIFCSSDMVAGVFRGKMFPGARILLEISNLLYFESLLVISILWCLYVRVRLVAENPPSHWKKILRMLPPLLFTVAAVTNPWTNILFTINESNLYERGPGVILHWVINWAYFLSPTIHLFKLYVKEKQHMKRQEITPMLWFALAPAVTSIIQMVFYGVTSAQAGITISIGLICLSLQNAQVLTDALTGINNRRSFDHYLADVMRDETATPYFLAMIDVDSFKTINDVYGHVTGDNTLKSIALSLKAVCRSTDNRLFLCRYGGDEFVIFGEKHSDAQIAALRTIIGDSIQKQPTCMGFKEPLSVSIGVACGAVNKESDIAALLTKADSDMYAEKMRKPLRDYAGKRPTSAGEAS